MVFAIFTSPVSSICVARSLSDQHLVSSRRRPPNTGISIAKSERTRIQFDLHALCFAGLEIDLYESFEFLWGPGHAGNRIGDIYLRDLGPNATASVRYIEGNDVYPVRRLVVDRQVGREGLCVQDRRCSADQKQTDLDTPSHDVAVFLHWSVTPMSRLLDQQLDRRSSGAHGANGFIRKSPMSMRESLTFVISLCEIAQ
jgi:hypothetical protein